MTCRAGENLRDVLRRAKLSPHNGLSRLANCHGLGTCGTCAVHVRGEVSQAGVLERIRLALPPLLAPDGLRLACKTRVLGDVEVTKGGGFWGQRQA